MKLIPASIRGKISLLIGAIAVVGGIFIGFYTYVEEIQRAKAYSKEKIKLALSFSKATREYVRGTLRPKIYDLMDKYECIKEDFILEAQSSSFVTSQIFNKVSEDFRGLILRQVAFRPLNPKNTPTGVEEMILNTIRTKGLDEFSDIVEINNYRYLVSAFPVKVKASCLRCHGLRENMPKAVREIYNPAYDPKWKVGSLQGGVFVYEPYEATILKAQISGILKGGFVFFTSIAIMGVILWILNRYVFRPINVLREHADRISKGDVDDRIPISTNDEIGQLARDFERMRISIKKVMDLLK